MIWMMFLLIVIIIGCTIAIMCEIREARHAICNGLNEVRGCVIDVEDAVNSGG